MGGGRGWGAGPFCASSEGTVPPSCRTERTQMRTKVSRGLGPVHPWAPCDQQAGQAPGVPRKPRDPISRHAFRGNHHLAF